MRGDTPSPQFDTSDKGWSEIETLVDETAKLARTSMSTAEFYGELGRRLVQATNAIAVAVWSPDDQQQFSIAAQIGTPTSDHPVAELLASRSRNIAAVARTPQPQTLLPEHVAAPYQNPTSDALVLQPATINSQVVAIVETFHTSDASPTELQNIEQLVSVFAEFVVEFHRSQQLRELLQREATWGELDQFADHVHRSLDQKATAFAIANEALRVAGCDRVVVFSSRQDGSRTLAISGLDTFDRRSTQVRNAERLARSATTTGDALWYSGEDQDLPPQLERHLLAYLDSAHVRSLAILPLAVDNAADDSADDVSAILFETFEHSAWNAAQKQRIQFVCRHSAVALRNVSQLRSLPLLGINRLLQRGLSLFSLRRLPKTAACVAMLGVVIAALAWIPTDFTIQGFGQLMPTNHRQMFAPADGVVEHLYVHHAQNVVAGEPLVKMRRADLEYEETKLLGEILTNQKRLDSIRAAILSHRPTSNATDVNELTSDEARLKLQISSLHEQQAILERERAELSIVSPIDGEVLTWGIEETLALRPVRRGERLLSVADGNGPWRLELRIADHDIEYVLAAKRELIDLDVSFILTSHAGETFHGSIDEIAMTTELDEHDQPTVLVRVAVEKEQLPDLRPGATVVAHVHCGRRSIGYVWLRELLDVIKTRVLF